MTSVVDAAIDGVDVISAATDSIHFHNAVAHFGDGVIWEIGMTQVYVALRR
jgi:hypothetical protein